MVGILRFFLYNFRNSCSEKWIWKKIFFSVSETLVCDGIWTELSNSLWDIPVLSLILVNHHQFNPELISPEIWAKGKQVDVMSMISNSYNNEQFLIDNILMLSGQQFSH